MRYEATPNAHTDFKLERDARNKSFSVDEEFRDASSNWRAMALERKYMNSFSWLGRPLIQFPGDVMAVQELISAIRPTVVIETGIAHGGSLILSSSMLKLNDIDGKVIGVDIEIRPHNRDAIESHRHADLITLYEGSSTDPKIVEQIRSHVGPADTVMVFLDSNHTHDHVLGELNAYSNMVSVGSYLVVFDTHVEDMPDSYVWHNRPWGKGNNPKTAVHEWIKNNDNFEIDNDIENQVLITSAPDGFLFRRS
ncbi:MAG: cephalosporin hydroxylase family protein [Marinibacterium sp.]|jgi:cephalosporin hydroxylase|nr:cephalosporin hydroxylase family protein [Marinibacterium sp.]